MEKFKNLGIVIVPNEPWKKVEERKDTYYLNETRRKMVKKIKDQFGLEVGKDEPLVQIRVFDADNREKNSSLTDHRLEWITQTEGTDKYELMSMFLPASLLKKYKQGDIMKLNHVPSGKEMEFKCLVKYVSVAPTWEDTLKVLGV